MEIVNFQFLQQCHSVGANALKILEVLIFAPFCRYDIILDAAGLFEMELEKYVDFVNSCGSIVTLRSPLLANIDAHGLLYGSVKSAVDLILPNLTSGIYKKGSLIKWAFFMPCETAIKEISELVNERKVSLYTVDTSQKFK